MLSLILGVLGGYLIGDSFDEAVFAEGGEVSKSWGVMLFKESKNRNGERIESAFNNLIMKGTLKQVIEDVKDELMGNIIYGTIKDRAGDVLVAKVKQDGTINIYREGYGIDKMAKGGVTSFGDDEYYIIVRTPKGLVTKKDFYGMGYNKKEIIDWCEERGWKYNEKGEKLGGQVLKEYEFFLKKPTKYDIQLHKKYEGGNVKGYSELLGKFDYFEIKNKDAENNIYYTYEKKSIGSPNPFNGTEISKEEYERNTK